MDPSTHTLDKIVQIYLALRAKKQVIRDEAAKKTALLDDRMDKMEVAMQRYMERMGLEALPTAHGTVYTTTTYRASITDWDAALAFVRQQQAWHLLTKKLSDVAVREFAKEDVIVPGTKLAGIIRVNVRSK